MYGLVRTAAPASDPVTLAEAKAWLRLDTSADDDLVTSLIQAATNHVETAYGRQLVQASWRLSLDYFPWPNGFDLLVAPVANPDPRTIRLPKAPLISVASVTYYDMGDNLLTLDPAVYEVDATTDPGRVCLAMNKVWPVTRLKPGAVRIAFTAGYGAASDVPAQIKTAIKLIVAHWYENRESTVLGTIATDVPRSAGAILASMWNGALEYGL
jgi:uncharacterized phiE125 gp8 family phage protein